MRRRVQHEDAAIRNLVRPWPPLETDVALGARVYFARVGHAIGEDIQVVFKSPIEDFDRAVRVILPEMLGKWNDPIGPDSDSACSVKPAYRGDLPIQSGADIQSRQYR